MKTQKITLQHITKVEGHAEVDIAIREGKVEHCHVHSVEGARYFEDILVGRQFDEASLITSRICGICSCGHTIASIMAVENALGIIPTVQDRLLRELITIGERIRSHASHLYFFSLPDFLGYESAIAMAQDHGPRIRDCLEMVRIGNDLVKMIGGRDMHPFVTVVGGVTRIPSQEEISRVLKDLEKVLPLAERTISLFLELKVPKYERSDTVFLALEDDQHFPLLTGDIVSSTGQRFAPTDYASFLQEHFHPGSTAKFASIEGKEFVTGALARINARMDRLSQRTQYWIQKCNDIFPTTNLFHNNTAQAIEILHWTERAIEILHSYTFRAEPVQQPKQTKVALRRGISAIEVPRGILFHDYTFDSEGRITQANIITPTVQNLASMECSVRTYLDQVLAQDPKKKKEQLTLEIERMIRAFDPCFSCSTHFLQVNWM